MQAVSDGSATIHVGDYVRIAFAFMKAVKKRGKMAQQAMQGRDGTRGRRWTQEVYRVVRVRKHFGDSRVDLPRDKWKYMVVNDEKLYHHKALQKASDSTIKRANMATALTELYVAKGEATDRGADRMPKG